MVYLNIRLQVMSSAFIELVLASRRQIFADRVYLHTTYSGLLEGKPNDEINSCILAGIPREMSRIFGGVPVFIQPPDITRIEEPHPLIAGKTRVVSTIPPVTVVAKFTSYTPTNQKGDASNLVVVWFQNATPPFLDEKVRAHLELLDWDSQASDFSW